MVDYRTYEFTPSARHAILPILNSYVYHLDFRWMELTHHWRTNTQNSTHSSIQHSLKAPEAIVRRLMLAQSTSVFGLDRFSRLNALAPLSFCVHRSIQHTPTLSVTDAPSCVTFSLHRKLLSVSHTLGDKMVQRMVEFDLWHIGYQTKMLAKSVCVHASYDMDHNIHLIYCGLFGSATTAIYLASTFFLIFFQHLVKGRLA